MQIQSTCTAVAGAALILCLGTFGAHAQDNQFFGGAEDVAFARELWRNLKSARLVGPGRINSASFRAREPHGQIEQVLATSAEIRGRTGRVIVKMNHGGRKDLTPDHVYADPNSYLMSYTIMFAREDGYDSENRNWFWVKYTPNGAVELNANKVPLAGRVAKGMPKGCIACHKDRGGADLEVLTSR